MLLPTSRTRGSAYDDLHVFDQQGSIASKACSDAVSTVAGGIQPSDSGSPT